MKKLLLPLLVLFAIYLTGCGSSATNIQKADIGEEPEWFRKLPDDPNTLFGAKNAVSTNMQLAIDNAVHAARVEIARTVQSNVSGLEKRFEQSVGGGEDPKLLGEFTTVSKIVTNQCLVGSKIKYQQTFRDGNTYRAYVLVVYEFGPAKQALLEAMKKDEELYNRYKASQAYKELDEEVSKLGKK